MTYPASISGLATDVGLVGPYQSSAGNYYMFGQDATTAGTLQCFKATATDSWSSVATSTGFGGTFGIVDIAGYKVADVIHLIIKDGAENDVNFSYRTFNMASDAFVLSETIATGVYTTIYADTNASDAAVVVRSGGEVVTFFHGDMEKVDKRWQRRLVYSRRTGTNTWTSPINVDGGGTQDYDYPYAVLGDSDTVHFLYRPSLDGVTQRALNSSNVLQTSTVDHISYQSLIYDAVSFDYGGTTRCVVACNSRIIYFDAGATPTLNVTSSTYDGSAGTGRLFVDQPVDTVYFVRAGSLVNNNIYMASSTDGGATWSPSLGGASIEAANIDAPALAAMSRFSYSFIRDEDILLPHAYVSSSNHKYNEHTARSNKVNVSLSSISSDAAFAVPGRSIQKSADAVSSAAMAPAIGKQSSKLLITVSGSAQFAPLIAAGGDVTVTLTSVAFSPTGGSFGMSVATEGGATSTHWTRLGPGGYPIAALPGGPGAPETSVGLFSITSPAAADIFFNYEFALAMPVNVSSAGTGLAVWQNKHSVGSVFTSARAATFGREQSVAYTAAITSAAFNPFGILARFWIAPVSVYGAADELGIEIQPVLESAVATAAVADVTPYVFTGTSVVLSSIASEAVVGSIIPQNQINLAEAIASAASNIIQMEGDEAFNLAAAAAAGTVGDLLVAIVIPAAIKWLVCASIDIMSEVAGDLAIDPELQATVIAAAALQGSPQIGLEVEGTLEIAPVIGGAPSMKEC